MSIVPDPDPAFPGHGYGLVHFDWHGPMPPPPPRAIIRGLEEAEMVEEMEVAMPTGAVIVGPTDAAVTETVEMEGARCPPARMGRPTLFPMGGSSTGRVRPSSRRCQPAKGTADL